MLDCVGQMRTVAIGIIFCWWLLIRSNQLLLLAPCRLAGERRPVVTTLQSVGGGTSGGDNARRVETSAVND